MDSESPRPDKRTAMHGRPNRRPITLAPFKPEALNLTPSVLEVYELLKPG